MALGEGGVTLEADRQAEAARVARAKPAIDVTWASALVVDDVEENRDLLVRRICIRRGDFHPGKVIAQFALTSAPQSTTSSA